MMKPIWIQMLYTTSILVVVSALSANAQAELVKQQTTIKQQAIVEDAITPEASDEAEEEVVVVRKAKPKTVVKKITREETEITPPLAAELPAQPVVAPPATKPSMGSQLDEGIKTKMTDVQSQFEQALLKTLDRIKITVDDGTAPQGSSTPTDTAVVQDDLVGNSAANKKDYMSVDAAPVVADDEEEFDSEGGTSTATLEKPKSERKVRISPLLGVTSLNSSSYNVSGGLTAGVELEMDVDRNFAILLGYSYAKHQISLANNGSFYNYYQPQGFNGQNTQGLEYNQNVFNGGLRVYLMPPEAKFRIFGGAGVGYNVGYLNYKTAQGQSSYQFNPYTQNTPDYTVKSWLGILEGGAAVNLSETVSLGALFKYALVFSSSENQRLNNYAFTNNFNYSQSNDQEVVGGSLASDGFYSILGTVKVAF